MAAARQGGLDLSVEGLRLQPWTGLLGSDKLKVLGSVVGVCSLCELAPLALLAEGAHVVGMWYLCPCDACVHDLEIGSYCSCSAYVPHSVSLYRTPCRLVPAVQGKDLLFIFTRGMSVFNGSLRPQSAPRPFLDIRMSDWCPPRLPLDNVAAAPEAVGGTGHDTGLRVWRSAGMVTMEERRAALVVGYVHGSELTATSFPKFGSLEGHGYRRQMQDVPVKVSWEECVDLYHAHRDQLVAAHTPPGGRPEVPLATVTKPAGLLGGTDVEIIGGYFCSRWYWADVAYSVHMREVYLSPSNPRFAHIPGTYQPRFPHFSSHTSTRVHRHCQ